MQRFIKAASKKSGMSPGTLVHIGDKKLDEIQMSYFDFDPEACEEKPVASIEEVTPLKSRSTISWINVNGVHDSEVIQQIGEHFNIHPLTLEDVMNTGQRPKVEEFDDYLYVVLKMLTYDNEQDQIHAEQVSLILGENYLLSFQENHGDVFNSVRERIRKAKGRIRKKKADYLLYALMDAVVDNYFIILEDVGETILNMEDDFLTGSSQEDLVSIHNMKRELIFFRKQSWHIRDFLYVLEKGESTFFEEGTILFIRDLYDHTIQVIDTIETFRDVLTGLQDLYLSSLSNKMNEVMKVLTIIATIFIPITFIAGVYGMNFDFIPELKIRWAYPAFWVAVCCVVAAMLIYFKKKKWL